MGDGRLTLAEAAVVTGTWTDPVRGTVYHDDWLLSEAPLPLSCPSGCAYEVMSYVDPNTRDVRVRLLHEDESCEAFDG